MGDGLAIAGYAEPSLVFLTGTHTQLLPNGAVGGCRPAARCRAACAGGRTGDRSHSPRQWLRQGWLATPLGQVAGFNYSRGRWVTPES